MSAVSRAFFITGGTSGIGAATARSAAATGHRVYVTGRSRERVDALTNGGCAGSILGTVADVGDWQSLRSAVDDALARLGSLDVVFANAGIGAAGDLISGDPDRWAEMVTTNVLGVALTIKATLPALIESRGRLVMTGSVTGRKVLPGSLYGATKWAVTALGESVRQQVREHGVGVTVIEPGIVDTPFWPGRDAWPHPEGLTADDVAATVMWAVEQPDHVDVNELLVRVKGQLA
ncbi:MAG: SDR family oxidoreductase [Trebonia sp.]